MSDKTLQEMLQDNGVSRRSFLKYCSLLASTMCLPQSMAPAIAESLAKTKKPTVIWLSFQECTGCTESLTRSHAPTVESLIFDHISLDYHHTLQAAAGHRAEAAREQSMADSMGEYILLVDGSIPGENNGYSTIAGISNYDMLMDTANGAAAIISIGTCAAFGGLPYADPNPTGARSVGDLITDKPIVNVPGCPPIPVVITGVVAHFLTFGKLPELDGLGRPKAFYGNNIHDRCYRRPYYERGLFAETFDDEGAKKGWCLYKLGCKGPTTYNACATVKWNEAVSFPIEAGHGCLGCSEPNFWDAGGFYDAVAAPSSSLTRNATVGVAVGAIGGAVAAAVGRARRESAGESRKKLTADDLKE